MPHVTISVDLTAPLAAVTGMEKSVLRVSPGRSEITNSVLGSHFCWPGSLYRIVYHVSRLKIGNI